MANRIIIDKVDITKTKIEYGYTVEGEWIEAFNLDEPFFVEYSIDISAVPKSVAVVPLLANLLPMSWVYDAEIVCSTVDKAFYDSIPNFKQGYIDMYPMMDLKGKLAVKEIEENNIEIDGGAATFFSGGVDAFNTLVMHEKENPTLITLWGADVKLDDVAGWQKVLNHINHTSKKFNTDYITIKTSFRRFLNEGVLSGVVKESNNGWWHGFQHGIGILCHAAPVAYVLGKTVMYFASSFHVSQKGQYTCASDPTIDNHVRFACARVSHDGYEFTRQDKIGNITKFSQKTGIKIPLRVCWESLGGSNCCKCEKCFRTIMGVYAEGCDPHDYGFDYTEKEFKKSVRRLRYSGGSMIGELRYKPIQNAMQTNVKKNELPKFVRWFYNTNVSTISKQPWWYIFLRKVKNKMKALVLYGKK